MKYVRGDEYRLSSGRRFYANNGIIGLGPLDDVVSEGYDGHVDISDDPEFRPSWTEEERAELADFMIARWTRWKQHASRK